MAERTVPWWRKALNFALDGIRSGFGLFLRAAKPASGEARQTLNEIEEPSEEERLLPQQPANPEPFAPVPVMAPVQAAVAEDAPAAPIPEVALAVEIVETISPSFAAPKPTLPTLELPGASVEPPFVPVSEPVLPQAPEQPAITAAEPAPEVQPAADAAPEPIVEQPPDSPVEFHIEPPVVELVEIISLDAEAVIEVEPAPDIESVDPIVEQPSALREEAEPLSASTTEGATSPQPAEEPVATTGAEAEPAPIAEELPAVESEELKPPAEEQVEPAIEIEPAMEQSFEVEAEDAFPMADRSVPEPDTSLAEELPSEPTVELPPEPLPEPRIVAEVEVLTESEPEPPAAIAAVSAPSPEAVAQPGEAADQAPAPESAASPEPAAGLQTPPVEVASAPESAAPVIAAPILDEKAAARLAARQKRLDEADEQSPFSVIVDQVYDGPLDLLLDLIRKQDIDIYDIPIAKITSQFLAYVNQLKASDVDVAGEFIYTASLLIHIKSKMLLPRAPAGPDDTPEDPRRELVERLLEHERFKNAAQMLQQKQLLEAASWTNPGAQEFKDDESVEPEIAADTVDLVRIFRDILERARTRPVIDVSEDQVTVGQMIQFLARRLTMEDKPVALRRLLAHTRSERALIAMFLALLELVRLQAVLLRQDRAFSEIFIKKHTGFDSVMNEGLVNARDDWK